MCVCVCMSVHMCVCMHTCFVMGYVLPFGEIALKQYIIFIIIVTFTAELSSDHPLYASVH